MEFGLHRVASYDILVLYFYVAWIGIRPNIKYAAKVLQLRIQQMELESGMW